MYKTKDNFKGFPMTMFFNDAGSVVQPQLSQSYTRRVASPYGFPYFAPGGMAPVSMAVLVVVALVNMRVAILLAVIALEGRVCVSASVTVAAVISKKWMGVLVAVTAVAVVALYWR